MGARALLDLIGQDIQVPLYTGDLKAAMDNAYRAVVEEAHSRPIGIKAKEHVNSS